MVLTLVVCCVFVFTNDKRNNDVQHTPLDLYSATTEQKNDTPATTGTQHKKKEADDTEDKSNECQY